MPVPATNRTVSNPVAINGDCPVTSQVLNVEFIPILTAPDPRSVTSKPESVSNLSTLTLLTEPVITLEPSISLTVKADAGVTH